jgi:RNA polymerase sigma-70 factor, ECF subfamily
MHGGLSFRLLALGGTWMGKDEESRTALNDAMDRYADGEDAAFGEVYDGIVPRLLSFFTNQVRETPRAEDLVQQTLLQLHAARRNYIRGSDVLPWAFAIGRNVLADWRRKGRREVLFSKTEDNDAALDGTLERGFVPDEMAETKQMADLVRAQFALLPEAQRAAFDLVRGEGLSIAETAQVLGTTPMAIKLRVHRVYEALRAVLGGKATRPGS